VNKIGFRILKKVVVTTKMKHSTRELLESNAIIVGFGLFQFVVQEYILQNFSYTFLTTTTLFAARLYFLIWILTLGATRYQDISGPNRPKPNQKWPGEFQMYLWQAALIEAATMYVASYIFSFQPIFIIWDFLTFVPYSICFEFIFDFLHYWTHRYSHQNPSLYKHFHKKHHSITHPTAITTFYQHPIDLILTNSIPAFISLYLIPFSPLQVSVLAVYKTYIEIAGHLGKRMYPMGSVPQLPFLQRLRIQLYVEDHDLHHTRNNCNYAKRLSIWDKVFGTYINGPLQLIEQDLQPPKEDHQDQKMTPNFHQDELLRLSKMKEAIHA
jgi:sterol desaturase/sphingolipid hydroxylase (fatty acid hydroxylase superfamily)